MFGAGKGVLQGFARRPVAHALKVQSSLGGFWQSIFKSWVGSQGVWSACAQFSDGLMVRLQGGVISIVWTSTFASIPVGNPAQWQEILTCLSTGVAKTKELQ